jgi:pyruvate kinase
MQDSVERTEGLRPEDLLADVTALRQSVAAARTVYGSFRERIERPGFAASALNLVQYLALRRQDLRVMQRQLMVLGLSTLGRSEGHVMASLDAVIATLSGLSGKQPARAPSDRPFLRGERRLACNTDELFGPPRKGRAGRIMVTLGTEAADDPRVIAGLVAAGADVLRINCGHGDATEWARMIANARAAAPVRPMRVLMDIAGPKVRTGKVVTPASGNRLNVGDALFLTRRLDPDKANLFQATCAPECVIDRLSVGDLASMDDGKLSGHITARTDRGVMFTITAGRLKGVKLKPERGLNFPGVDLGLDPLTEKDRGDLDFVALNADLVGMSFVQTAAHVADFQLELAARRPDWQRLGLVAKIETPMGVRNLPDIIVQGAGRQPMAVMIARGDLAVEIGFERVAEVQQEILWLCEAAQVPAIWATQVLEGLVQDGLPSRSEMTDAATATQAECVMLNKGPNQVAAVAVLDRMFRTFAENQTKKTPTLRALKSWPAPGIGTPQPTRP